MTVDAHQRELLAQFLDVAVVHVNIDRPLEQERLVQPIEPLLNLRGLPFSVREVGLHRCLTHLPDLQDRLLQQPRVPGRRLLREPTRRVLLERPTDERSVFRVMHQALAKPRRIEVAERRLEHPAPEFESGARAGARAVRAHVVVELRECRKDAFHQLSGGGVVDRLRRRSQ